MPVKNSDSPSDIKPKTQLINEQIGINGLAAFGHTITNKPDLALLNHHHRTKLEFILVVGGIQKFIVSEIEYTLYAGEAFIIQPEEVHCYAENLGTTELVWFQIDLSQKDNFLNLPQEMSKHLLKRLCYFEGRKLSISPELMRCFLTSYEKLSTGKLHDRILGQCAFTSGIATILDKPTSMTALSPIIDNAKQYILTHIEDKFDTDMLIGKNNLSHSEFKLMFKEQTGFTPRDFINQAKVASAKNVIASTKISINDIAYEYCFSSVHYFNMVFKQYTGLKPKEYRKKFSVK